MKKVLLVIILLLISGCKEEKEYLVTFDSSGGSIVMDVFVHDQETITEPPVPQKDEYVFVGWYQDDTLYDFSIPVTKDITLRAHWLKKESCNKTCEIGYRIDNLNSKDCICIKSNTPVLNSISIDKDNLSLGIGEQKTLLVTYTPPNVPFVEIKWSSSNNDVALVDNGVVTGISPGEAIITAFSGDIETSINVKVIKEKNVDDYLNEFDMLTTKLAKELNNNYGFGSVSKNNNNISVSIIDKLSIALNTPIIIKDYLSKIDKNISLEYVIVLDDNTTYRGSNKELELNSLIKTLRDIYHGMNKEENILNIKVELKLGKDKKSNNYIVNIVFVN